VQRKLLQFWAQNPNVATQGASTIAGVPNKIFTTTSMIFMLQLKKYLTNPTINVVDGSWEPTVGNHSPREKVKEDK